MTWVRQNGKTRENDPLPCWNGIETQVLQPGASVQISTPVPRNDRPFSLGFEFRREGPGDEWITVWAVVRRQVKSLGLTCDDPPVRPGTILAETCLVYPPRYPVAFNDQNK